jgi:hypothetical protein
MTSSGSRERSDAKGWIGWLATVGLSGEAEVDAARERGGKVLTIRARYLSPSTSTKTSVTVSDVPTSR